MSKLNPFKSGGGQTTAGPRKPIQEFISQVKAGGLARANRFAVVFAPPQKIVPATLSKILLFCDSVQLPGQNFSTTQNRTFGEFREVPYERIYDNITLSFYVDKEMRVKRLFDDWQNIIANPTTRTYGYYDDYVCPVMTIEVQDIEDKTRYSVSLHECYPKTVNAIQLDHNSKDIMKLSVGMQYKYWTATRVEKLANGEEIPADYIEGTTKNFTGFQQTMNTTLGTRAANFLMGAGGSYLVTKLPSILKF